MVRRTRAEVVCILLRAVSSVRPALPNTQRSVRVCGMDKFTAALMAVARGCWVLVIPISGVTQQVN